MAGILFTSASWGNFGLRIGDDESDVLARRKALEESISIGNIVFMNQTHSNEVVLTDGRSSVVDADAIVTSSKGVGLSVLVGDCVPILIRSSTSVAAIHAGRIGMTNGIIGKTVELMKSLGAQNFEAIMGPSICADCYEVSTQMYADVVRDFPHAATSVARHGLDLQSEIGHQLSHEEVEVFNLGICTLEYSEYFSHRRSQRTGSAEGRQIGVIWL